jgi:hypothetical protein
VPDQRTNRALAREYRRTAGEPFNELMHRLDKAIDLTVNHETFTHEING